MLGDVVGLRAPMRLKEAFIAVSWGWIATLAIVSKAPEAWVFAVAGFAATIWVAERLH